MKTAKRGGARSAAKNSTSKSKTTKPKNDDRAKTNQTLRQSIEVKAYELYQQRGAEPGNDWQDWYEAERIVTSGQTKILPMLRNKDIALREQILNGENLWKNLIIR